MNMEKRRARPTAEQEYYSGVKKGRSWRNSEAFNASPEGLQAAANMYWSRYYHRKKTRKSPRWNDLLRRGLSYTSGFMKGSKLKTKLCPVPLQKKAAAVVCAAHDPRALHSVLKELNELPLEEIVVVLHEASDEMFDVAKNNIKTVVAHFPEQIDPDVGRALGAKLTGADTLLFVDGEQRVSAEMLAPFLWECDRRLDVALNDISAGAGLFHQRDGNQQIYEFLNASLKRTDLKSNSLTVLPFALSRHAFNRIGAPMLAVPAKAHVRAILAGLRIGPGGTVKFRSRCKTSTSDERWRQSAGDHVEAWGAAITDCGSRLSFADRRRNRTVLGDGSR